MPTILDIPLPELMTALEVAKHLGMEDADSVSTVTLKNRLNRLEIQYVKIGTRQLYEAGALEDWFADRQRAAYLKSCERKIIYTSELTGLR